MLAEILEKGFLSLIGVSVFFGVLFTIYFRDAHRWRYLHQIYGAPWQSPLKTRRFQHAVASGNGVGSKSYNGFLTIGVHPTGFALRLIPPFSLFQKPLFIPYREVKGWDQFWYMNVKTIELEFASAPDIKLVMPAAQVKWLQESSQGQLYLTGQTTPHRQRPTVWYAVIVLQGLMALGLLGYFVAERWAL